MIMTVCHEKWAPSSEFIQYYQECMYSASLWHVVYLTYGIFADDYDNKWLFDSEVGAVKWIYPTNAKNREWI